MVVGGRNAEFDVEIVDLLSDSACNLKPRDIGLRFGSVGAFVENEAAVCEGFDLTTNACTKYNNQTDEWESSFATNVIRYHAASVPLSSTEWWLIGGYTGTRWTEATEICSPSIGCSMYVNLPTINYYPQAMKVSDEYVFLLPNSDTQRFLFDLYSEKFKAMPTLRVKRAQGVVGTYTTPTGEEEIVVAGGSYVKSSEIFSIKLGQWREGPDLPVNGDLEGAVSVPYEDTFLVVSGRDYGHTPEHRREIYKFDPRTESWITLQQKLSTGRKEFAAFLIPDDLIDC